MLDSASDHHLIEAVYWVSIAVGAKTYMYPLFSYSHFEALSTAMTEHQRAGHPLPAGTCCYVDGPCHDRACQCGGKIRIIGYITQSTTSGASSHHRRLNPRLRGRIHGLAVPPFIGHCQAASARGDCESPGPPTKPLP